MAIRSDQKALIFLGAVAVLGAGVRVVRAATSRGDPSPQPALERQAQSADSAARMRGSKATKSKPRAKRGSQPLHSAATERSDSLIPRSQAGPLDHAGYIRGKLDLDVATAAQIDSLPGVSAAMARKIVLDRIIRGPFVTRDGLRRVRGAGAAFVAKIDTLVTFSGTVLQPTVGDTAIPSAKKRRR
jgi:DNA uptake protein ComE-like DNA-binding protein